MYKAIEIVLFVALAYYVNVFLDVSLKTFKLKRVFKKKKRKAKKQKFFFDIDFAVQPSEGHTHDVVFDKENKKILLKAGMNGHGHKLDLSDKDIQKLSAQATLTLNSSHSSSFDSNFHSHQVVLSI